MRDYLDKMQENALGRIATMSNADVLSKTVDEWIADFLEEYASPEIPVLDTSRITRTEEQGQVRAHPSPNPKFSTAPMVPGLIHHMHVPYTGNRNFFFYQPDGWPDDFPGAAILAHDLVLAIGGAWYTPKDIEDAIDRRIAEIERALQVWRSDAERFRDGFPGMVRPMLEKRRQTAEAESQTATGLKYPLKPNPNAPQTHVVPAIRRKITPAPLPAASSPDPTLLEANYQHILSVIENMTKVMERSPAAFATMEEEHIRFHYLVQLNGQYDGVTGEAFNFQGKTDILVKQGNHNLFVAECKFWGGAKALHETVDQLFGYVTWRDTKTAVIIFVKARQSFTAMVEAAVKAMAEYPHVVGNPAKEGETRYRYTLRLPNDPQRRITITLMLFDMPKP